MVKQKCSNIWNILLKSFLFTFIVIFFWYCVTYVSPV